MGLQCPKCGSSRIRQGYETPPLPLRLVGMQALLCDNCNLSYRGFAIPFTVPLHTKRKSRHYRRDEKQEEAAEPFPPEEEEEEIEHSYRARSTGESVKVSEVFSFSWYYLTLLFKVLSGRHQTSHPLSIKYRWRNWQHWQHSKRSE